MTKPTVLVADDDADDRLVIEHAFAMCGAPAELRFVTDGEELLEYLRQTDRYATEEAPRPGLILLDLNMPRKDGAEAAREIKSDAALQNIPVVMLTTSDAPTDKARAHEAGVNSFFTKPSGFEQMVELLEELATSWLCPSEREAEGH